MAHTYEQVTGIDPERVSRELERQRKRKPAIAIASLIAGVVALLAATYFSFRDVPAPQNPANARPHLVEPYQ
jgi:hypothetical protein